MPRRQDADDQLARADYTQARSLKSREDAYLAKAVQILRQHTHLRERCVAFLQDCLKHEGGDLALRPTKQEQDPDVWNDKYTKIAVLPGRLLKQILQRLNRVSFSAGNLRQKWRDGPVIREPPAEELHHILEWLTDWPEGVIIPPSIRSVKKFTDFQQKVYVALGSLGMNLELPICWESQGPWRLVDQRPTGKVMLGCRHSSLAGVWREVDVQFTAGVSLSLPWSWSRALVQDAGGSRPKKKLCILVFPEVCAILNGAKDEAIAANDGVDALDLEAGGPASSSASSVATPANRSTSRGHTQIQATSKGGARLRFTQKAPAVVTVDVDQSGKDALVAVTKGDSHGDEAESDDDVTLPKVDDFPDATRKRKKVFTTKRGTRRRRREVMKSAAVANVPVGHETSADPNLEAFDDQGCDELPPLPVADAA